MKWGTCVVCFVSPFLWCQIVRGHLDVVSCLMLSEDGSLLVTGSRDAIVFVWTLVGTLSGEKEKDRKLEIISEQPR